MSNFTILCYFAGLGFEKKVFEADSRDEALAFARSAYPDAILIK